MRGENILITSFEKLGELLSEWENRFSLIENSLPNSVSPPEPVQNVPEPEWSAKQRDAFLQLKSEVVGWRQKHAEMMVLLEKLTEIRGKSPDPF